MKNNINEGESKIYDILIIGAGPGGLTAAIYGARAMATLAMIEKSAPGGKVVKTSEIYNYPGFTSILGPDLAIKMFMQTQELKIPYIGDRVERITKNKDNLFELQLLGKKTMYSRTVIIATGTVERKIGVPGEAQLEGRGVSYCAVCDGALFKGKDIVVVGGGYAAFEEALYLTKFARNVYLVHRRQEFRADPHVVEKARNHPQIKFFLDCVVKEIVGVEDKRVTGIRIENIVEKRCFELKVDAVFPYIGSNPLTDFIDEKEFDILDKDKYIVTNVDTSTKVPGLFAVGDVRVSPLRQIVTATADGAIAAQEAIKYLDKLN